MFMQCNICIVLYNFVKFNVLKAVTSKMCCHVFWYRYPSEVGIYILNYIMTIHIRQQSTRYIAFAEINLPLCEINLKAYDSGKLHRRHFFNILYCNN